VQVLIINARNLMRTSKILRIAMIFLSLIIILTFIFPYAFMVLSSFKTNEDVFKYSYPLTWKTIFPPSPTIENYPEVFIENKFNTKILNSIFVASVQVIGTLTVCSLAAFAFSRFEYKGRDILFGAFVLTALVPFEVMMIPLYMVVRNLGLQDTYWAYFLPWIANPFGILLLRQSFIEIPRDLDDAAAIEGASKLQIFWHVILPNTKASMITLALFSFINSWNSFLWPLIVVQDPKKQLVQVAIAGLFKPHEYPNWGGIFAAASMSTIPVLIIFLFLQKHYVRGMVLSGIKG